MDGVVTVSLVAIPLAWLLVMAGYAYVDAKRHGMNPRKWAAISLFVPLFGFFAYIFERDERTGAAEPANDHFTDGAYRIHESRADERSDGQSKHGAPGAATRSDRAEDDEVGE